MIWLGVVEGTAIDYSFGEINLDSLVVILVLVLTKK